MEQSKPAMRVFNTRVTEATYRSIVDRAAAEDVPVAHLARRLLVYALLNMPPYWVPPARGRR